MSSELEGVAARFEELRARIEELGADDRVLAEIIAALQEQVVAQTTVVDSILDQLPSGLTVIDPEYRVTRFNERAREITGHILSTATPMNGWLVDLFHLDGSPMEFRERPSIRSLSGETVRDCVFEIRDPERGSYLVAASAAPIRDANGDVILAVTLFEDVTVGRRHDKADHDFVANVAHQIRNPLAAIASAAAALSAGAKNYPVVRDRFLAHITREVSRMEQLADGLLALARAQREETSAPLALISLKPLLQRVIDRSSPKTGVNLALFCPDDLDALTNEALMGEALANVVTNAVQHTTHGTVTLRGKHGPSGPSIEVCDEGPGIAAADREHVFERFFRGSAPAGTGVGLGLAVAAAATSAAGGALELVDSPVGACFRFTFQHSPLIG
jgi:signal transduction histidine kinase